MQYREFVNQYSADHEVLDGEFEHESAEGKQYRRRRSIRATRGRRSKAAASKPGCGIGARRQRRWTW